MVAFGPVEYSKFLMKKFEWTWNDSDYYVTNKIGWSTLNVETLPYKYILGDESDRYLSFSNIIFGSMMLLTLFGVFYNTFKDKNEFIRILHLTIIGTAIFLLIWETRSRYIYLFIPFFVLMAVYGQDKLSKVVNEKISKFKTNKDLIEK